jgi:hypothetical protein
LKKKQKKYAARPLEKVVTSLMDMFCGGHWDWWCISRYFVTFVL